MSGPRLSIIPARAATDRALKPRDLQVLCVLGRHTDDLGWCRRSQVKMAEEIGCARSTVFDAIERLVGSGYLERHAQHDPSGRDSAHVYRVVLDPVHPNVAAVEELEDPADQPAPPAAISAPPAGSGPAPINDPELTKEKDAGARDQGGKPEAVGETPRGAKSSERAFERAWRDWPTSIADSRPAAMAAWNALDPAERDAAALEAGRYVEASKATGRQKLCSFGVYLREKRWQGLPPAQQRPGRGGANAIAPPFGPVWAAMRMAALLDGPQPIRMQPTAFLARMMARDDEAGAAERLNWQARHAFPAVNFMHAQAANRRGMPAAGPGERLAPLMEAVPIGSVTWQAWKAHHEKAGWPWLPDPGDMRVVYFPAGGPEGLAEFKAAICDMRGNENDDGNAAAAE